MAHECNEAYLVLTPAATFYDACRHLLEKILTPADTCGTFFVTCGVYVGTGQCVLPSVTALCWVHCVTGTLNRVSHFSEGPAGG